MFAELNQIKNMQYSMIVRMSLLGKVVSARPAGTDDPREARKDAIERRLVSDAVNYQYIPDQVLEECEFQKVLAAE